MLPADALAQHWRTTGALAQTCTVLTATLRPCRAWADWRLAVANRQASRALIGGPAVVAAPQGH